MLSKYLCDFASASTYSMATSSAVAIACTVQGRTAMRARQMWTAWVEATQGLKGHVQLSSCKRGCLGEGESRIPMWEASGVCDGHPGWGGGSRVGG